MKLIADLHIHSRFSRATSRSLDFVTLARSALEKGIQIVGTGDFTHPGWLKEIEEQLEPAEDGLFRLRPTFDRAAREGLPAACASGEVRFCLQVEISNIYKKDGRVRKNHNLVYVPTLDAAKRFNEKLGAIGNLASDGRPILGLDARDLLEITLSSDPLAFLIPAHIWTPWFSMLGSKSGFDTVEECFGDLTDHIFAAETGLSSDPPMNWRVGCLDGITLVSNSDAHSAGKLGREANLFDIELGYEPLLHALRTRQGFEGTLEFYPEEGKYHLDGHRKCDVRLEPEETRKLDGRCPVCGGSLTVGVMSRVMDLADRAEGSKPDSARAYSSMVALNEIAGEVLGVGPDTRGAQRIVTPLLEALGPELHVLRTVPIEDISRVAGTLTAEAIRRVRLGELTVESGYDGEYGTVRIFDAAERARLGGQGSLLAAEPKPKRKPKPRGVSPTKKAASQATDDAPAPLLKLLPSNDPLAGLDADQKRIAEEVHGPLLVVAGPGSGKTRTLVARIAHLVSTGAVAPQAVLAITFTNQAAEELEQRLTSMRPERSNDLRPMVCTFHRFGTWLLEEYGGVEVSVLDEDARLQLASTALGEESNKKQVGTWLEAISLAKQQPDPAAALAHDPGALEALRKYEDARRAASKLDLDDLVLEAHCLLRDRPDILDKIRARFPSISVDEYQDVNDVQAALVKQIAGDGRSLCAIGDPDQAIYGFRGSRPGHFLRFAETFAEATTVRLDTSYRLTRQVAEVGASVLGHGSVLATRRDGPRVEIVSCASPKSEAEQILVRLERLVGGTSHFAVDSDRARDVEQPQVGFGDVAVLVRTKAQRAQILEALGRSAVPCRAVGLEEPHDPRSEKVAVMTLHASKGREFEVVFIAGVEPGLMPLEFEGFRTDLEEERRLLYVGITRAKHLAVVSYAAKRTLFGKQLTGGPSPWLDALPHDAVERIVPHGGKQKTKQLSLF